MSPRFSGFIMHILIYMLIHLVHRYQCQEWAVRTCPRDTTKGKRFEVFEDGITRQELFEWCEDRTMRRGESFFIYQTPDKKTIDGEFFWVLFDGDTRCEWDRMEFKGNKLNKRIDGYSSPTAELMEFGTAGATKCPELPDIPSMEYNSCVYCGEFMLIDDETHETKHPHGFGFLSIAMQEKADVPTKFIFYTLIGHFEHDFIGLRQIHVPYSEAVPREYRDKQYVECEYDPETEGWLHAHEVYTWLRKPKTYKPKEIPKIQEAEGGKRRLTDNDRQQQKINNNLSTWPWSEQLRLCIGLIMILSGLIAILLICKRLYVGYVNPAHED